MGRKNTSVGGARGRCPGARPKGNGALFGRCGVHRCNLQRQGVLPLDRYSCIRCVAASGHHKR